MRMNEGWGGLVRSGDGGSTIIRAAGLTLALALSACASGLSDEDILTLADTGYHAYCAGEGKAATGCGRAAQTEEAASVTAAREAIVTYEEAKANGNWTQALQDHEQTLLQAALNLIASFKHKH